MSPTLLARSVALCALLLSAGFALAQEVPTPPRVRPLRPMLRKPEIVRPRLAQPRSSEPEKALATARCDGKYAMLLAQIAVPEDVETYGPFNDWGPWSGNSYAGHVSLPAGHWVYVQPHWYIWRDLTAAGRPNRNWGPEQVVGDPDTPGSGDIATAWASRTPDGQQEWLLVEFERPIVPKCVIVHETYNPGALVKVGAFRMDGTEITAWSGEDPTRPDRDRGESVIPLNIDFPLFRVRLYLDSPAVSGWNEIDAVGLGTADGKTRWATAVHASSSYAEPESESVAPAEPPVPVDLEARVSALEARLKRLEDLLGARTRR